MKTITIRETEIVERYRDHIVEVPDDYEYDYSAPNAESTLEKFGKETEELEWQENCESPTHQIVNLEGIKHINFESTDQIAEYWEALKRHKLDYHLDDDPEEIMWHQSSDDRLTPDLFKIVLGNHDRMWNYCHKNNISPWDYVDISEYMES